MSNYINAEKLIDYLFSNNFIYASDSCNQSNWKKTISNSYNVFFFLDDSSKRLVDFEITIKDNYHYIRKIMLPLLIDRIKLDKKTYKHMIENF